MSDDLPEVAATPAPETTAPVEPTESTAQAPAVAEKTSEQAEKPEAPATPEPGDDTTAEPPKKHKGGFQKRIDELTRERNEERLQRQMIERELNHRREQEAKADPYNADPGAEPT